MEKEYRLGIFFKDFYITNINKLLDDLIDNFPMYDGSTTTLPIPDDVQNRDIPRIILKSQDSQLECQISFSKVVFVWRSKEESLDIHSLIDDYIVKLQNTLLGEYKVVRLGFATVNFEMFKNQSIPRILSAGTSNLVEYSTVVVYKGALKDSTPVNKRFDFIKGNSPEGKKVLVSQSDIGTLEATELDKNLSEINIIVREMSALGDESVINEVKNGKSPKEA